MLKKARAILLAVALAMMPVVAGAQIQIQNLPAGASPSVNDYMPLSQSSTTVKDTLNQVAAFLGVGTGAGAQVSSILTANGLAGGPITTVGTVSLSPIANGTVLCNLVNVSTPPVGCTAAQLKTLLGLGTASMAAIGTSGATIPKLNTVNVFSSGQNVVPVTLNDAATITPDFSTSDVFNLTLTGNGHLLANPSRMAAGKCGEIFVTQDAVGGHQLTYGSNWKFPGGNNQLTTTPSSTDVLSFCQPSSTMIATNIVPNIVGSSAGPTNISNAPFIPAAGTAKTTLVGGESFATDTVGYTLQTRFIFDPNATPTAAQDVPIRSLTDLGNNFNPLYSFNVDTLSGNSEWERYEHTFTNTAHQFVSGSIGNPGYLNLVATAPGGINNGGITSGMIATKLHFQPNTTSPVSNHGIAMRAIIKGSNQPGDFPAFWCYQLNGATAGPNELDFWEGFVSDPGTFWTTSTFQDGTGITAAGLATNTFNPPGWNGFGAPLPNGADFSTGFHKMEMVWTSTQLAVYFDDVMMRLFNYSYTATLPVECYINFAITGNGTAPSGQQTTTTNAIFPQNLSTQEWAIYTTP